METIKLKIERTINTLLETARPDTYKEFKLFKHFKSYYDYKRPYEEFQSKVSQFYAIPRSKRRSSSVEQVFKIKIPDWDYQYFVLGFHNTRFTALQLHKASTNLEWLVKQELSLPKEISNSGTFLAIFDKLFHFGGRECYYIGAHWFIEKWRQHCFYRFGSKYEYLFEKLAAIILTDDQSPSQSLMNAIQINTCQTTSITQTQLEWVKEVKNCLDKNEVLPHYPLSKNIEHPQLRHLDKLIFLHNKLPIIGLPEDLQQKVTKSLESVCTELIKSCTAFIVADAGSINPVELSADSDTNIKLAS